MVNYRAAFNASTCNLLSCVISISPYSTRSDSEPVPVTPGERKSHCLPAEVPGVWRFINIRRNLINTRQGCSTFILALALWRSLARRTNALSRWRTRTGPDALFARGSLQDVYFRHHFFNRAVQTPGDPFSSSISRMYCGIASASGAISKNGCRRTSLTPESGSERCAIFQVTNHCDVEIVQTPLGF